MINSIYPCFWFEKNAQEAAKWYCSLFEDGEILQSNKIATTFKIGHTKIMFLNGGPIYKINSAISLFTYCGGEEKIDALYHSLSTDGKVLMPLDKYAWTSKYAWVEDQFGINWQLDMEDIRSDQKIVPALMFTNKRNHLVKQAMDFYTSVFPISRILMEMPFPDNSGMPEKSVQFAQVKISEYVVNIMSGGPVKHEFDFSEGVSLVVSCKNQAEKDHYWKKLGIEGSYSQNGWLKDRFGVSWQIVLEILSKK